MDILIEIFSHAGISTNTIWYFSIIIALKVSTLCFWLAVRIIPAGKSTSFNES